MRSLLWLLILLASFRPSCPQGWFYAAATAGGGGTADETFDPTGSPGTDLTWTDQGTGTFNRNLTVSPINGAESFNLIVAGTDGRIFTTFTAVALKKVRFRFRRTSNTGTCALAVFQAGSNGSIRADVSVGGTGALTVTQGSVQSSATSNLMSTGTDYYIWFQYIQGTGAGDGVARAGFSTTTTEPAYTGADGQQVVTGDAITTVGTFALGVRTTETCNFTYDDWYGTAPP